MILSKHTMNVLKNFSTINPNFIIEPGNRLATVSNSKNIFVEAYVEEEFPFEFVFYDLTDFLTNFSLFDNPDIEFTESQIYIRENNNVATFGCGEKDVVFNSNNNAKVLDYIRERKDKIEDIYTQFSLSESYISQLKKRGNIMNGSHLVIEGKNGKLSTIITKPSEPNTNKFITEICDTDKEFSISIKLDNIKLIPENYEVYIAKFKGGNACFFVAKGVELRYLVSFHADYMR